MAPMGSHNLIHFKQFSYITQYDCVPLIFNFIVQLIFHSINKFIYDKTSILINFFQTQAYIYIYIYIYIKRRHMN